MTPYKMLDRFYNNFLKGIKEYNTKEFFECHDTWEEIWHELRGIDRLFLQGLIHSAIGHYHLSNMNWKGARSQFEKCHKKLEPYGPMYRGINIEQHLDHLKTISAPLTEKIEHNQPVKLSEDIYPKLKIEPPPDAVKLRTVLEQQRVELKKELLLLKTELKINAQKNDLLKTEMAQELHALENRWQKKLKTFWIPASLLVGLILGVLFGVGFR